MKVSQPSAELINLCLNEATHLSLCALTTAHHSPPSHYTCTHRSVTKLEFWVTDGREFIYLFIFFEQSWVPKAFIIIIDYTYVTACAQKKKKIIAHSI